jgi:hypothetical protein
MVINGLCAFETLFSGHPHQGRLERSEVSEFILPAGPAGRVHADSMLVSGIMGGASTLWQRPFRDPHHSTSMRLCERMLCDTRKTEMDFAKS